jgi:phosphoribosyl-ATP pyrophosphohydrolase/phosphoribosyl-AMP cyclohydrolase
MNFSDFDLSKNSDALLPVVVQDSATLKVLMVAYMNEEAFEKTKATKLATFYSRSRNALWVKGETSGNYIEVEAMYADCDNDTLLLMGKPHGPVCHRGTKSCFDTKENEGFIRKLQAVVHQVVLVKRKRVVQEQKRLECLKIKVQVAESIV